MVLSTKCARFALNQNVANKCRNNVGCNYRRRLFFMVCDSIQTQQQEWMSMKLLLMTLLNR